HCLQSRQPAALCTDLCSRDRMFGMFKKRAKPDFAEIRELLFADIPLSDWKPRDGKSDVAEPWSSFESARVAVARGDSRGAVNVLRSVVDARGLESRQYLQAWHFLRTLGVQPPPDVAKRVHGVVLEVHLSEGLDTLAAYADHAARYVNHGGKLIVWEISEDRMDSAIDELLHAGQRVADAIGPWTEK